MTADSLSTAVLPMHLVTHSQQNSPAKRRHLQEFARAVQAPLLAVIERLNRSNEALLKSKHAAMASEKEVWTDRETLRAELAQARATIERPEKGEVYQSCLSQLGACEKELERTEADLATANAVIERCARIMRGEDVQDQGEAWDLTLRTLDAHLTPSPKEPA